MWISEIRFFVSLNKRMLIFRFIIFLTLLGSLPAKAKPKKLEVWFLSIDNRQSILAPYLKQRSATEIAQAKQCQPMGDMCFDPQVGLYKKDEGKWVESSEVDKLEDYDFIGPASSVDRSLIECDERPGMFDIFCGKAKAAKKSAKSKITLWIDVSSTLRQIDASANGKDYCYRESFVRRLNEKCPFGNLLSVYTFTSTLKQAGAMNQVCGTYGLNNVDRLMQRINESVDNHLIVVTDVFEVAVRFVDYIEAQGGIIKGVDRPLYAKEMLSEVERLGSSCSQK